MDKEIDGLLDYLSTLNDFSLPSYKELPSVDLYMEQVLKYINSSLGDLFPADTNPLTSFMVNNYVKAKMISEPNKKKYSRDQIGYLMAICLMKTTLSMGDMSLLLELDDGVSTDKGKLYAFFCNLESTIIRESSVKAKTKVASIAKLYKTDAKKKGEKAAKVATYSLALLALQLAIQSQANKLLSDNIISHLRKIMHGEEIASSEQTPSSQQLKHEAIVGEKEASRLAQAKTKRKNTKKDVPEVKKEKTNNKAVKKKEAKK